MYLHPSDGISRIFIFVQVTDAGGDPVTGLAKKNFNVWRGMSALQISSVVPQGTASMPGIYAITLTKTLGSLEGQVVYTIRAKTTGGKTPALGWTLADLIKL